VKQAKRKKVACYPKKMQQVAMDQRNKMLLSKVKMSKKKLLMILK
jgi:hypothetical protein